MKKSLIASASASAIFLAAGAQAADLGGRPVYKAPAAEPVPWAWTGFYIGGNVGAAWGRSSISDAPGTTNIYFTPLGLSGLNANGRGVIGGVQAGYNWQVASFVLGLEGDFSGASLDRSTAVTVFGVPRTYRSRLNWLATIRGRIGVAFGRTLIYGTGGAAFAGLNDQLTDPGGAFTASPGSNFTGWTVGGGVEYAFADRWTAKAEYLHIGFRDRTATAPGFPTAYAFRFRDSVDVARVGINYKF
jgi:outer membrane immunogenic protein